MWIDDLELRKRERRKGRASIPIILYKGEEDRTIIKVFPSHSDRYKYCGFINAYFDHGKFWGRFSQSENDLDVLKLKCLLKAKDIGWDIKDII
tara:strand:+ start:318 stop:596 length:279 start_codon:yes stop_codon:yes gene_type:complete